MKPLTSVVLPTRDRPAKFHRAIKTVLAQTYDEIELVVIDGSEQRYASEKISNIDPSIPTKIKYESSARGVSAARNIGIRAAEGSYIAFLDDDDEWESSKIAKQVRMLENSEEAGASYTGNQKLGPEDKTRATSTPTAEGDVTRQLLFGSLFGTFSALVIDQALVDDVGFLDESLQAREDWDYYLRLSLVTEFRPVTEPLVIKHTGDYKQLSDDFEAIKQGSWRLLNKHESLAKDYGEWQKMNSRVRYGLGYSAAMRDDYSTARRYFTSAIRWYPLSFENYLWLTLVLGGPITLIPAQRMKRIVSYTLSS